MAARQEKKPTQISQRRELARSLNAPDYVAKRAEVVRAGAEVFREKGLRAATLNDVAAKLGQDRAGVYYYVASKEELFQECITDTVVKNLERIEVIDAQQISPREKLWSMIEVLIDSQVEHYPYMYVYMQEDMARAESLELEWAKEMVARTRRLEGFFIRILRQGIADGSFRADLSVTLVANSIFGMTQWTHRWWVPGESRFTSADLSNVFASIFFEGVDRT